MLRAPTLILLLVAAAALVAADGKDEHVAKRATDSIRAAVQSLHERYADCAGTPLGCKRDTEEQLRALPLDLFAPMKRALKTKSLKDKMQTATRQLRDAKDAEDMLKRAEESVAKAHEKRAKEAVKTLKRNVQKTAALKKGRDVAGQLKDSTKRFAELPWKRAVAAFEPLKRQFQKKAAVEKINRAKKHIREVQSIAKVNGLMKRAQESLKQKRDMDMFAPLKRALQMKVTAEKDAKREAVKGVSQVKDVLKRAQESVEKTRQVGSMKRMVESFFGPAKRGLQKQAIRSKMEKATRALKTKQMKDSVKRTVEKLTTKRDEVKRMKDEMSPLATFKRNMQEKATVAKLRDATETFKRALRDIAK